MATGASFPGVPGVLLREGCGCLRWTEVEARHPSVQGEDLAVILLACLSLTAPSGRVARHLTLN